MKEKYKHLIMVAIFLTIVVVIFYKYSFALDENNATNNTSIPDVLNNPTDHRPVPTVFEKSKDLNDNYYFDMPKDPDPTFDNLLRNRNYEIIADTNSIFEQDIASFAQMKDINYYNQHVENYDFLGYYEYGEVDENDTESTDLDIDKVIRLTTLEVPTSTWGIGYKVQLAKMDNYNVQGGDTLVVHFYARNIDGGQWETGDNRIQVVFSDNTTGSEINASIQYSTRKYIDIGTTWTSCYITFYNITASQAQSNLSFVVNPVYYEGTIEIGNIKVYKFGNDVDVSELPNSVKAYEGHEEDAEWRVEANNRIEQIRKGNVNITLKNENGKPINNTNINIDMYEHEFKFSVAANTRLVGNKDINKKFREKVVENFNSIGTEGSRFSRKNVNEDETKDYDTWEKIFEWAERNGVNKDIYGLNLISNGEKSVKEVQFYINYVTKGERSNLTKDDEEAFKAAIEEHIKYVGNRFPNVTSWVVTGEQSQRFSKGEYHWYFGSVFGREILIDFYNYVKKYMPNAHRLWVDNYTMGEFYDNVQKPFMDWAVENVDFDILSVEGHSGYNFNPVKTIEQIEELAKYGKTIRVTELDSSSVRDNVNYQGNIARDALIAYFSMDCIDYIQLWGLQTVNDNNGANHLLYDENYNLKPGGLVYQDLVYNKWWTREKITTDENGKGSLRAYYGDYDITVDGKTISIPIHKGNINNVDLIQDSKTGELIAVVETSKDNYEIISTSNSVDSLMIKERLNGQLIDSVESNESYVINRLNFLSVDYQKKQDESYIEATLTANDKTSNIVLKGIINDSDEITVNKKIVDYTGNNVEADVVSLSGENVNIAYYNDEVCANKINGLPVNVGKYYIIASTNDSDNYYGTITSCQEAITINKIDAICPTINDYIGIYDGNSHGIIVNGGSGGTIEYRISSEDEWSNTIPTRKDVGETTVYVQIKGDSNHNTKNCGSKNITINEKIVNNTLKDILENSGYNIRNGYVTFTLGEEIATIKNKLGSNIIIETDKDVMATGIVIKKDNESYTIVIKGDINKDGKIKALDYIAIRNHMMNTNIINNNSIEFMAADMNNDDKISALDYIAIRNIMMKD